MTYQTHPYSPVRYGMSIDEVFSKLHDDVILPEYQHEDDSGMDIRAYLPSGNLILSHEKVIKIPTGLTANLPPNTELLVRNRSGLASKGIIVTNSPGTIDEGYKYVDESNPAEIKILLFDLYPFREEPFEIEHGMRIAQLIYHEVDKLLSPKGHVFKVREGQGFGSTGTK